MTNKEKLKKVNLLLDEMKVFVKYLDDFKSELEERIKEDEANPPKYSSFCDRHWGAIKNRAKSFRNSLLEFYR
jgi:hypothetical protein